MARLIVTLLGVFQARLDGEPITAFESNKVRGLLAYLAAEASRPQRREALATLLWPDWPQQSALRNLSYALADLRKNIGDRDAKPSYLLISRDTLQLNPESDVQVDLWEFEEKLSVVSSEVSAGSDQKSAIQNLQSAINLYQGRFLEDFSLTDSAPFEEWLAANREFYQRQMLQGLSKLAGMQEEHGEYEQGLVYARRQLELEPWREEAHQQVMRLLALNGQRGSALAQYETCRRLLKEQLNVEPGQESVQLYEAIRDGTLGREEPGKEVAEQPPAAGVAPFKGLKYFDVGDAGLFFGREALTKQLVNQIWEMVAYRGTGDEQGGCCFLAVVGASGSGKSSLVRAGLVAALQKPQAMAEDSSRWPVHVITPTAHPLEALALSLTRDSLSVMAAETLIKDMQSGGNSLHLYVNRLLMQSGQGSNQSNYLLLVIDQLEELFTLCRSEAESSAFIENLLNASHGPALVVVTLRADFYADCARYPGLRQALCTRQEYIGPMTSEELRRAIEEPAKQGGWEFEAGLVDLILRDVGDEPGALPLLEHALLETWQRRNGRTMTLKGYATAGGVKGAIAHTADAVYGHLSPEQQEQARRIFLRLTELGEGTQDTRRRAPLSELIPNGEAGPTVQGLLKTLADARLVTISEDTAEVAHEALIREWPALRAWLSEDRESLHLHRRLTEAAQEWQKLSKDSGELYRGTRLAQALEWAAQPGHANELNALEQEFLTASQQQAEGEEREREAQRQRELEAAQKLAETERKRADEQHHSARRLRRRAIYLAGVAGLAVVLMVAAAVIAYVANNNARQATARQYRASALADLNTNPGQSISEALQSLQIETSVENYSALHQAMFANHLRSCLDAGQGKVYGIAVSPNGDRLATIGSDRVLKVWRLNGTTIEQPPLLSIPNVGRDLDQVNSAGLLTKPLQFSPDGKYLATINNLLEIVLLNSFTGEKAGAMEHSSGSLGSSNYYVDNVAFFPNSSGLNGYWLAASAGNVFNIIEFGDGNTQRIEITSTGSGQSFAFLPDLKLVTGGWDVNLNGELKIWNLPTQSSILNNTDPAFWDETLLAGKAGDPIYNIGLSPDGSQLAYMTSSEVHLLDLTPLASGGSAVERLTIPFATYGFNTDLVFLPGGERLVTVGVDGTITIWDAVTGQPLFKLAPEVGTLSFSVSPVDQVLFTALGNGEICSWDVAAPGSPEWLAVTTGGGVAGVFLNPDGVDLLSFNIPNANLGKWNFTRWRIDKGQVLRLAEFTNEKILDLSGMGPRFSPTRIAIPDGEGIRVENALTGDLIQELEPGPGVSSFIVNSDESRIYFGRSYGMVDVWDVDAAQKLNSFRVTPDKAVDHPIYLALSGDGTRLLTWGSSDPVVRLWDVASGQPIQEFTLASGAACNPALTPDNYFLVTCGDNNTVLVWEVASGKLVRSIQLPAAPGWVQISPDSRYLVVSLSSSQSAVFDFAGGRELVVLPGSPGVVNKYFGGYQFAPRFQFSPDSRYILTTFPGDQTAYGFILDNNELVQLACQRLAAFTLPGADGVVPQLPICATASE